MKHPLPAALLIALTLASYAEAAPVDAARAAYRRHDYARALRLLRPLARHGDAAAQSALGAMYDNGEGTPENHATAADWYLKAAKQGDAGARLGLGLLYFQGLGVEKDVARSYSWFDLALAAAHRPAKSDAKTRDFIRARAAFMRAAAARTLTHAQIARARRDEAELGKG